MEKFGSFRQLGVPFWGSLLFRVLGEGPYFRKLSFVHGLKASRDEKASGFLPENALGGVGRLLIDFGAERRNDQRAEANSGG